MRRILPIILVLLSFIPVFGQQSRSPEQERLAMFVGSWTLVGEEANYLEVCAWIMGNHVQCTTREKTKTGGIDSSYSYLSYIPSEKQYVYYGLSPSGNSRTMRGRWEGDRLIFEGERILPDKRISSRVTLAPLKNGNFQFTEEASVNGGPYEKKADFEYKRVR